MTDFLETWAGHVRLALLIILAGRDRAAARRWRVLSGLAKAPGGSANLSLLADILGMARDDLRTDLTDMGEVGLVLVSRDQGVLGAAILTPGREVLQGLRTVDTIAPPPQAEALQEGLSAVSLKVTVDHVREHLAWLRAAGLVGEDGAITDRGRLVAQGRDAVEGVREPSPETALRLAASAAASTLSR
ncbi:hypothetical protein [Rhodospirillum sp. A1_3_36]|uniref:hypothetical protein n=1 Tax=Rhodospirillum sp. A1_3_36 TaxID=3391666 RepID=UPI0039A6A3A5